MQSFHPLALEASAGAAAETAAGAATAATRRSAVREAAAEKAAATIFRSARRRRSPVEVSSSANIAVTSQPHELFSPLHDLEIPPTFRYMLFPS
jgi:hypothetical protein